MSNEKEISKASENEVKVKKAKKQKKKTASPIRNYIKAGVMLLLTVGVVIGSIYMFKNAVKKAAASAKTTYGISRDEKAEEVYNEYYQRSFDKAEEKNHVSNRVDIVIDDIKELAEYEVLSVSDVEYVIPDKKRDNADVWLKVEGEGVFTTDMDLSEFVVDQESGFVLVRLPAPVLSHVRITNRETLLYEDKSFRNYSNADGADRAREMEKRGLEQLRSYMKTNQNFYKCAQKNAEIFITSLVKECNPDLPDLKVMVEFFE